jgi:membrane protein YdbS with pleckstrin-like domain
MTTQDEAAANVLPDTGAATDSIADGVRHRLDPAYVSAQRTARWIVTTAVAFALGGQTLFWLLLRPGRASIMGAIWLGVTAFFVWMAHIWPAIAYRYASYIVGADGIEIHRGVVWRRIINVPRSRVQHTDVSQGPIERSYQIGTLVIFTAGTDHARVSLPGLPYARALSIRDHLLPEGAEDGV